MKKLLFTIAVLFAVTLSIYLFPTISYAKEANTINELKQELSDLKSEKAANDKAKSQTKSEISSNNDKIYAAYQEQEKNEALVVEAENKIVESEAKIEEKNNETNELMRFEQLSNGENAYIEYVSGASSTTDLIMRTAIVEQLTEYNKQVMEELNALIEENKQLQIDLAERNKELEAKQLEYEKAISKLGSELSQLTEIGADYSDQIKMKEELIKYYETVCDSDDQLLTDCVGGFADISFLRPLNSGYVSSAWGYRTHPISGKVKSFHNAIDIAGNKEGTTVYSAANGMVAGITRKASCGGNTVYVHHIINGVKYTTQYTHLLAISVSVGDVVTKYSQIGTVGGGSQTKSYDKCSTGAHLHFGVAKGHYLGSGSGGYTSYSTYLSKSINPLTVLPSSATKWSSRG